MVEIFSLLNKEIRYCHHYSQISRFLKYRRKIRKYNILDFDMMDERKKIGFTVKIKRFMLNYKIEKE